MAANIGFPIRCAGCGEKVKFPVFHMAFFDNCIPFHYIQVEPEFDLIQLSSGAVWHRQCLE